MEHTECGITFIIEKTMAIWEMENVDNSTSRMHLHPYFLVSAQSFCSLPTTQ